MEPGKRQKAGGMAVAERAGGKAAYGRILVALDGSEPSAIGGDIALTLARTQNSELLACHVSSARLHEARFRDLEPGLDRRYHDQELLGQLRQTHASLISDGLNSLSQGYMDDYLAQAQEAGVPCRALHPEGRNYLRILQAAGRERADLLVLGASGLGQVGDGNLGSTANRVLRHAACDVLLARAPLAGGRVLVGLDGSRAAAAALVRGALWARALNSGLSLAAAFDPFLHISVFRAMAASLSDRRQQEVGLGRQEELHHQIIDSGLAALYQGFLDAGREQARTQGLEAETVLLQGKAYHALAEHLGAGGVDLAVVGRHGHHQQELSLIGSNAESLARLAPVNLLVASSPPAAEQALGVSWSQEAEARLTRIPPGPRAMARAALEQAARGQGLEEVTAELFDRVAASLGMGPAKDGPDG